MSYFSAILKKNKFHNHCWSIRNNFSLAHLAIVGIKILFYPSSSILFLPVSKSFLKKCLYALFALLF